MHSKSGPGGTLYHYGLCELAQRQAVLLRQDKSSDRAIKSDRAKVVMTAGCISRTHWHNDFYLQYLRRYVTWQIRIFEFLSKAKYHTPTTFIDSKGIAKNKD